jgi:hypothetical protein
MSSSYASQLAALAERRAFLAAVVSAMADAVAREGRLFTPDELDAIDAVHCELRVLSAKADALRRSAPRPALTLATRLTPDEPDGAPDARRAVAQ